MGESLELAPFRHAYDPVKKQIHLHAANFQAHASSVKDLSLYYDAEQKPIVNWRRGKDGGRPTVAWTFEPPESGVYDVSIEYASNKRSAGQSMEVIVDRKRQLAFTTRDTGGDKLCQKNLHRRH